MRFKLDFEKDYMGIFIMGDGRDRCWISKFSPKPGVRDEKYTLTRYDIEIIGVDDI